MIVLIAPIAGRLADRIGPRPLIVGGLSLVALALFLQTRIDVDTGYGLLLPAFVLMGIGMALVMSPMSTAAMNSVEPQKAGVGSGILSMNRMVGATFGVAAIGALFQHLARDDLSHQLAGTGVSEAQREQIVHNLGAGGDGASLPPQIATAAHDAFIHAFASGMWLSAGVAAVGAIVAFWLISPKQASRPDAARHPEAAAEAVSPG
jgi:MFS family permease